MKRTFVKSALLAMAIAVPAQGALADGSLTSHAAFAQFDRMLEASGIKVITREFGLWVPAGPLCWRIVGSEDKIVETVKANAKYRCKGLLSEYTVICDLHDLDCPPRRFTYVVVEEPDYEHDTSFNPPASIYYDKILEEIRSEAKDELTEEKATVWTAVSNGLVSTGVRYGYDHEIVRLGHGSLQGIDEFDTGSVSGLTLPLE